MKATIKNREASAEFTTPERCHIIELSNTPDDEAASIAEARVEPGVTTRWHCLKGVVERYVILAGKGRVEVGGLPAQDVKPGDVVLIPAGSPQRIADIGAQHLVFFAICTPRFTPEAYEDIDPAEEKR